MNRIILFFAFLLSAITSYGQDFCSITDAAITQLTRVNQIYTSDLNDNNFAVESFRSPKSGIINSVCFIGQYTEENYTDDFTIIIYQSVAQSIGPIIAGPMPLTITNKEIIGQTFNRDDYGYHAVFDPVEINASFYWVSIYNNTPDNVNDNKWRWAGAEQDLINGPYSARTSTDMTNWSGTTRHISLSVGFAPPPIPTIGQWGIIALGLLFLIFGVVTVRIRKTLMS